jgi:signal transduction histidine kinase
MTTQGNDDKFSDSTHDIASHRRAKGGPAGLLILSGVLLWGGAGALMTMPAFLPRYAWIFTHAAKHGVTSGPLLLFGLCLISLGLVARAVAAPRDEQEESQQRLRFDQLESALTLVRECQESSRADLAAVRESSNCALEIMRNEQANAAQENRQDAIFRMAASLDQVAARLDQRLQAQQTALQAMIQELSQSIAATQEQVKELARSKPGISNAQLMGRAIEIRNSGRSDRMSPGSTMTSGTEGSLGLLDTLDDFGAMQGQDGSHGQTISIGDGHHAHDPVGHDHMSIDAPIAPLPRDGAESAMRRASNGAQEPYASEISGEFSTRDKLELLRSLMDDVRVREALGALTGSDG